MEEQIKKATDWWVNQLSGAKFDNGDPSPRGGMVAGMAVILASSQRSNLDVDADERLREEMTKYLTDYFQNDPTGRLTISTDYGPDYPLSEILDTANIPGNLMPWKTVMWISPDSVRVQNGYHAEVVTL